jgi:hypothetical protein
VDNTLLSLIGTANCAIEKSKENDSAERILFEDFMTTTFVIGKKVWIDHVMRRNPEKPDTYAEDQMENMWWVWKSRAAVARGEIPEAYPVA